MNPHYKQNIRAVAYVSSVGILALLGACEVKKTQEGELPKVTVEGGQVPKYEVEGPDVKVEKEKKTITVPDIDVVTPEEQRKGGNVEPGDPGKATPTPAIP